MDIYSLPAASQDALTMFEELEKRNFEVKLARGFLTKEDILSTLNWLNDPDKVGI